MIVNIEQFNSYSGNYEDSKAATMIKENFLSASEEIVKGYLGYDPLEQDYDDLVISGTGESRLYLPTRPATMLKAITINDTVMNPSLFRCYDDRLLTKDRKLKFPKGTENISLSIKAGWSISKMPGVITLSILRIATLMLSETGGNIGISSKSFADNSRTFVNYTPSLRNHRQYIL